MKIQKDTLTNRIKKPPIIYSKTYLECFGQSINKYKKTEVLSTGEKVLLFDWDEIYFRAGVKTKQGRVTWYLDINGNKISNMEKFDEVYRQWRAMVDGRNYAEEKKFEQLDKTAEEMKAEEIFANY